MGAAQERFPSTITALQSGVASQRARHDEAFVASVASARQFGPVLIRATVFWVTAQLPLILTLT